MIHSITIRILYIVCIVTLFLEMTVQGLPVSRPSSETSVHSTDLNMPSENIFKFKETLESGKEVELIFQQQATLGRGTDGVVYQAQLIDILDANTHNPLDSYPWNPKHLSKALYRGNELAIKVFPPYKRRLSSDGTFLRDKYLSERDALQFLDRAIIWSDDDRAVVQDIIKAHTMEYYMKKAEDPREYEALYLAVIDKVKQDYRKNGKALIHLDLRPNNLMVVHPKSKDPSDVVVIDFGRSEIVDTQNEAEFEQHQQKMIDRALQEFDATIKYARGQRLLADPFRKDANLIYDAYLNALVQRKQRRLIRGFQEDFRVAEEAVSLLTHSEEVFGDIETVSNYDRILSEYRLNEVLEQFHKDYMLWSQTRQALCVPLSSYSEQLFKNYQAMLDRRSLSKATSTGLWPVVEKFKKVESLLQDLTQSSNLDYIDVIRHAVDDLAVSLDKLGLSRASQTAKERLSKLEEMIARKNMGSRRSSFEWIPKKLRWGSIIHPRSL
jgi:hypothetical protein